MGDRRMLSRQVISSDAFLDMAVSARFLYVALSIEADDCGFVNSARSIMRRTESSKEDLQELIDSEFVYSIDGIIIIKHWYMNNYLQKDRLHDTDYGHIRKCLVVREKRYYLAPNWRDYLKVDGSRRYTMYRKPDTDDGKGESQEGQTLYTDCIQTVYKPYTETENGASLIEEKRREEKKREDNREREQIVIDNKEEPSAEPPAPSLSFLPPEEVSREEAARKKISGPIKPTVEEVAAYCLQKGYTVNPETFVRYMDEGKWMYHGKAVDNWRAIVDIWQTRERPASGGRSGRKGSYFVPAASSYMSYDEYERTGVEDTAIDLYPAFVT